MWVCVCLRNIRTSSVYSLIVYSEAKSISLALCQNGLLKATNSVKQMKKNNNNNNTSFLTSIVGKFLFAVLNIQ